MTVPISHPQVGSVGNLIVYEGVEPADAIEEFSNRIHLPLEFRGSIINGVCDKIGKDTYLKNCTRWVPLLLNQSLSLENSVLPRLELFGGAEPADTIDRWA